MLFNSLEFFIFAPIVFILYWFVFNKKLCWQNLLLLGASYFFYGWWSWKFLILLALSTLLDFFYAFGVASPNKRKAKFFLWLSIINNLGILGVFKYYDFFIIQFKTAFELINIPVNPTLLQIALPVGISFYTFHGMSYVFDIYRGLRKPVKNFVEYAVFVCFFPLLVAGPIERANHLLPQVQSKRIFNYFQAVGGLRLILWGMFTKVVIADRLAFIVDPVFSNPQSHSAISLILAAIGFSFQVYADFSGYSNIAIGTAKLFGFELLSNFRFPYFSRDIAEFWRRWHISLSSWFRDYLYIPLGGSKKGKLISVRNTFIIFLVSGFWHGASWNFIVWGGIHACGFLPGLISNRNRRYIGHIVASERMTPNFKELAQMASTFAFVTFAWIFFRSRGLKSGVAFITQIVVSTIKYPGQYFHHPPEGRTFLFIIPFVLLDWYFRRDERILRIPSIPRPLMWAIYVVMVLMIFLNMGVTHDFIYFQF